MHKVRTPWPVATRVEYIVAFEECRRRFPTLSIRRFCVVAEKTGLALVDEVSIV